MAEFSNGCYAACNCMISMQGSKSTRRDWPVMPLFLPFAAFCPYYARGGTSLFCCRPFDTLSSLQKAVKSLCVRTLSWGNSRGRAVPVSRSVGTRCPGVCWDFERAWFAVLPTLSAWSTRPKACGQWSACRKGIFRVRPVSDAVWSWYQRSNRRPEKGNTFMVGTKEDQY